MGINSVISFIVPPISGHRSCVAKVCTLGNTDTCRMSDRIAELILDYYIVARCIVT